MNNHNIALIQMHILPGQVDENRRHALELCEQAADQGAGIIVLPEMWTTGYSLRQVRKLCETEQGPSLTALRELAIRKNVHVIAGSIPYLHEGQVYNGSFTIAKTGELIASYQKIHLIRLMEEQRFFVPGCHLCSYDLDDVKTGTMICYDLRFPELARSLAVSGVKLLVVPAEWPSARGEHWRTLVIARAIENQLYVAAVNCVGQHKDNVFYGHSMLVDPWGRIVCEGQEEETILIAKLDVELVDQVRRTMPVFADRRPEVYSV